MEVKLRLMRLVVVKALMEILSVMLSLLMLGVFGEIILLKIVKKMEECKALNVIFVVILLKKKSSF